MAASPLRFLLIEDDDDHAVLIERTLARQSNRPSVHRVSDGESALEYLKSHRQDDGDFVRPDVILLDLNVPKFSGHEILEAVKSDPAIHQIPVVVLTSSNAEVDRLRAYTNHANSFLVKPVDFEQFRGLIHDLNQYWGERNERPVFEAARPGDDSRPLGSLAKSAGEDPPDQDER